MKASRRGLSIGARLLGVGVVALLIATAVTFSRSGERLAGLASPYTASQASIIGTTGRPQLIEFFHRA